MNLMVIAKIFRSGRMKNTKIAVVVILILFLAFELHADTECHHIICGQVFDSKTKKPVRDVLITVLENQKKTRSDSDGKFTIRNVCAGRYQVLISHMAYGAETIEIKAQTESDVCTRIINLMEKPIDLPDVVVTSGTFSIMETESSAPQSMTREEIETVSQVADDIYRAVTRLPGITSDEFSARFNVRGGTHDQVLVLLDGMELYQPFHIKDVRDGAISIIDAQTIAGIDLYTGGFTAEYGNRISGVFDIRSRQKSETEKISLSTGVSFLNMRLMAESNFADQKGFWLVSARRGYMDLVFDLMDEHRVPTPDYHDFFGKFSYKIHPGHNLSFNVLYAKDDLNADESNFMGDYEIDSRYTNIYLWTSLESELSDRLSVQSLFSYTGIDQNRIGTVRDDIGLHGYYDIDDQQKYDIFGLKQDINYSLLEKVYLKLGWDVKLLNAEFYNDTYVAYEDIDTLGDVYDFDAQNNLNLETDGAMMGLYSSLRFQFDEPLTIEIGGRFDRITYTDDADFSPRINAIYRISRKTNLRLGWGKFIQPQGIHELDIPDNVDHYFSAQKAEHYTIGLEHHLPGYILFRAEGYYKDITELRPSYRNWYNFVSFTEEVDVDRIVVYASEANIKGLELHLKKGFGDKFTWWASYSLSYSDEYIDSIISATDLLMYKHKLPSPIDQRHTVYFDLNYRPNDFWTLNIAWSFHSGWPYTNSDIKIYLGEYSYSYNYVPDSLYTSNLPAYHCLNMRITRLFKIWGGELKAYLEFINLYDRENKYALYKKYRYHIGEVVYYDEKSEDWLPFMPSVGISWSVRF